MIAAVEYKLEALRIGTGSLRSRSGRVVGEDRVWACVEIGDDDPHLDEVPVLAGTKFYRRDRLLALGRTVDARSGCLVECEGRIRR